MAAFSYAVSANASTMVSVLAPLRGLPLNTTIFIRIPLLHATGARHTFRCNQNEWSYSVVRRPHLLFVLSRHNLIA